MVVILKRTNQMAQLFSFTCLIGNWYELEHEFIQTARQKLLQMVVRGCLIATDDQHLRQCIYLLSNRLHSSRIEAMRPSALRRFVASSLHADVRLAFSSPPPPFSPVNVALPELLSPFLF